MNILSLHSCPCSIISFSIIRFLTAYLKTAKILKIFSCFYFTQMDFSLGFGPKDIKHPKCERCEQEVKPADKLVMDRKTIHKSCFKCAVCDKPLEHGSSGLDQALCRYGPIWLCRPHLLMDPVAKEQAIVAKGYKQKFGKK